MRIRLIDADSIIPNLALMQISGYHKSIGDKVGFNVNLPDKVYLSVIFKENADQAMGLLTYYYKKLTERDIDIDFGGSGLNLDLNPYLPEKMQKFYPDYELYNGLICQKCQNQIRFCKCSPRKPIKGNMDYSMGFTTRGCIRKCSFCIVPDKEGKLHHWQHPKEFYNPEFKKIMLLDNNWLADKKWFFETSDWIMDHKLKIIEHGMDIRLIDMEIAQRLKELKFQKGMHFAFDSIKDEYAVKRGIAILKKAKIDIRSRVQFYVLVGFDTTQDQDKYRCRLLKSLGTNAFVMPYVKNAWTNKIARWANRKESYWTCDIDDYDRSIA